MNHERPVILNVDDNEIGRYSKSRILKFAGYEVLEAGAGNQALSMLIEHMPDLMVLDVNLPDISGFEVCERAKRDARIANIPVILTSADFTKGTDKARGLAQGADGYLTEPLEPEVMQATISSLIRTKHAEDRTRAAISQWESTFSAISEAIALLDQDCVILRHNRSWKQLADGVASVGMTLESFLLAKNPALPLSLVEASRKLTHFQAEIELDKRWYALRIEPINDSYGLNAIVVFNDITDRREAEQKIILARNAAESANAAKDRFLAVLSHELRTPLTPVLMLVDALLSDDTLTEDEREIYDMIHRNIELEARLIDDLLDLNRISRGKITLRSEQVDIHATLKHALQISKADCEQKDISIETDFQAKDHIVTGDSTRLQQVFWNLVKNAVKFTPPGGSITARSSNPDGHSILISFTDTGIGMEDAVLKRVFEPFEQADDSITKRFGGLGLGLAISKSIVDLHHGSLTASSLGVDQGSTFSVTLPLTTKRS